MKVWVLAAGLCITAGCAAEISRHTVDVEGDRILVMQREGGVWVAVSDTMRGTFPAHLMPKYIKAIEATSGCKVDRDAMAMETWVLEAGVKC